VCCVVDSYSSYVGKYTRQEFSVPTRTLIAVNLLSGIIRLLDIQKARGFMDN
jgi:hypothetical protein